LILEINFKISFSIKLTAFHASGCAEL